MVRLLRKRFTANSISFAISSSNQVRILWHVLFYTCLLYNFHRYIFKYSHGGYPKEGYQQTPLVWQAGKFALMLLLLIGIYIHTRFVKKIAASLLLIYGFLTVVFIGNLISIVFFQQVATDEIEYLLFAFMLFPIAFFSSEELEKAGGEMQAIINNSQYIIIISNWIVIFNYFVFRIVPFHAYEGILLRFGGFWDDPNTLAILSALLLGYALFNKQYIFALLHVINILLTISFNGYLLLLATITYFFINTPTNRLIRFVVLSVLASLLFLLLVANYELFMPIYEAKRESVEQHSTVDIDFHWLPFVQPIQFHETWWISLFINYFPLSILVIGICIGTFVNVFFIKPKSLQRLMFILFFITNLFLPFLYMFPINFIAILFLLLYVKGVKF